MTDWTAETAEWYARNYGDYPTNRLAVETLQLPADAIVVDVGCGTGSALRHASIMVTQGRLIGIDPVPRMLEIARASTANHPALGRITFQPGAAENLPLANGLADVVLAFDSFDHWQDPCQGLAEVRRVLRTDGRFVVVKDGGIPGANKERRAFTNLLQQAGFRVTSEQEIKQEDVNFMLWTCSREQER